MAAPLRERLTFHVERLLKELGWSRTDLAGKVGVTPSAISQWLNEKNSTPLETLDRLAAALKIDVTELIKPLPTSSDGGKLDDTTVQEAAPVAQSDQVIHAKFGAVPATTIGLDESAAAALERLAMSIFDFASHVAPLAGDAATKLKKYRESLAASRQQRRRRRGDAV